MKSLLFLFFCLLSLSVQKSTHTNNWAILIDTSRFWFNYRHIANTMSVYYSVKKLGIPDSQILLLLADDMACNPRNIYPGVMFNNENHNLNIYPSDIEVDYRGYEVTVENFIRLLTGRQSEDVPRSKRLLTDDKSNILVYMTGHGGDQFLKFQDSEEISSHDIADAFEQMYQKKRYNEILFMVDTCQACTLYKQFYSPNIIAIGSSRYGENSYSHHTDSDLGLAILDRFTYHTLEFFSEITPESNATLLDLFSHFDSEKLYSHADWRAELFQRPIDDVLVTDFFGNKVAVSLTESPKNSTLKSKNQKNEQLWTKDSKLQSKKPTEDSGIHKHKSKTPVVVNSPNPTEKLDLLNTRFLYGSIALLGLFILVSALK